MYKRGSIDEHDKHDLPALCVHAKRFTLAGWERGGRHIMSALHLPAAKFILAGKGVDEHDISALCAC